MRDQGHSPESSNRNGKERMNERDFAKKALGTELRASGRDKINAILIPNVSMKTVFCVLAYITLIHTSFIRWILLLSLLYNFPTFQLIGKSKHIKV